MDDMSAKLNAILNDPASMERVMSIAKSLSGGETAAVGRAAESEGGGLPALIGSVTPTGDAGSLIRMLGSLDPKVLNGMSRIVSEYGRQDDDRVRLLHALKPYLRESRREKMDQAVRVVKLAHTARVALEAFR